LIANAGTPEPQASDRLREAERRAVERWRPAPRWYYPAIGRVVITASLFITRVMNRLDLDGREHLAAVQSRDGRGLLTISNHVSLFDDPLLTSNFVRGSYKRVRWAGADALNFFGTPFKAWFLHRSQSRADRARWRYRPARHAFCANDCSPVTGCTCSRRADARAIQRPASGRTSSPASAG
jgi:hypothetical protein